MTVAFAPAILRTFCLCCALGTGISAASPIVAAEHAPKKVTVLGRDWHVVPSESHPGRYEATRLNHELAPFRPPAMIGARQAARAFRAATGCQLKRNSLVKTISGTYIGALRCPSD
jgi:hypothetical protein